MKQNRLGFWVFGAVLAGMVAGYLCHQFLMPSQQSAVAGYFTLMSTIFLRMIKMIIAPLVFTGIVAGLASFGDATAVRRIGLRAFAWFICASIVSLSIGLVLGNLANLGQGLTLPSSTGVSTVDITPFNLSAFVTHIVPTSIFKAMADNEILPILVFSVFFGLAAAALRDRLPANLIAGIEGSFQIMLKVTSLVMWFTPIGVFGAVAAVITIQGASTLTTYGQFILTVYSGMVCLWMVLFCAAYLVLGHSVFRLIRLMRTPLILGFSTSSGEAAFPKTIEQLTRFGVSPKVSNLILPLAYSFNLDGMMMYLAFSVVFIAQVAGIDLTAWQQFTMLLVMMVMSKGVAGVPRAAIVVIGASLPVLVYQSRVSCCCSQSISS